jgi:hypothetical protein
MWRRGFVCTVPAKDNTFFPPANAQQTVPAIVPANCLRLSILSPFLLLTEGEARGTLRPGLICIFRLNCETPK